MRFKIKCLHLCMSLIQCSFRHIFKVKVIVVQDKLGLKACFSSQTTPKASGPLLLRTKCTKCTKLKTKELAPTHSECKLKYTLEV